MSDTFEIRCATPGDLAALEALYPEAFPDENLLPLVRALTSFDVTSIVATIDDKICGDAAFTPCSVNGTSGKVALLAPVAIAPHVQRQGLGSAIIHRGLQEMREAGMTHAFTLGDPAYYGRFGFSPEDDVAPPYPLPEEWREAWQSLRLSDNAAPLHGTLCVPSVWQHKALWLP